MDYKLEEQSSVIFQISAFRGWKPHRIFQTLQESFSKACIFFKWQLLSHPPYSQYFAPSDFIYFQTLHKVPSGAVYPNQCYCLFLKSAKYVALTLEIASTGIYYINTTLKEFSHILCEAHDLDLKGKALVQLGDGTE